MREEQNAMNKVISGTNLKIPTTLSKQIGIIKLKKVIKIKTKRKTKDLETMHTEADNQKGGPGKLCQNTRYLPQ